MKPRGSKKLAFPLLVIKMASRKVKFRQSDSEAHLETIAKELRDEEELANTQKELSKISSLYERVEAACEASENEEDPFRDFSDLSEYVKRPQHPNSPHIADVPRSSVRFDIDLSPRTSSDLSEYAKRPQRPNSPDIADAPRSSERFDIDLGPRTSETEAEHDYEHMVEVEKERQAQEGQIRPRPLSRSNALVRRKTPAKKLELPASEAIPNRFDTASNISLRTDEDN